MRRPAPPRGDLLRTTGRGGAAPGKQIGPLGGHGLPAPEDGCAFKGCLLEVAPTPGASAPTRQPARTAGGASRLSPPLAPSDTCLPPFTRFRSSFSGRPLGSSGGEAVSADPAAGSHLTSFERSRGPASGKSHPAGRESVCSCARVLVCVQAGVRVCVCARVCCVHAWFRAHVVRGSTRVSACVGLRVRAPDAGPLLPLRRPLRLLSGPANAQSWKSGGRRPVLTTCPALMKRGGCQPALADASCSLLSDSTRAGWGGGRVGSHVPGTDMGTVAVRVACWQAGRGTPDLSERPSPAPCLLRDWRGHPPLASWQGWGWGSWRREGERRQLRGLP